MGLYLFCSCSQEQFSCFTIVILLSTGTKEKISERDLIGLEDGALAILLRFRVAVK